MKNIPLINRELSWLSFNERVLQEAEDERVPLFERIRFLGIFSNNLDEFFRVRVATVKRMSFLGKRMQSTLNDDPTELLSEIHRKVVYLQNRHDKIFINLTKLLRKEGVFFRSEKNLSDLHIKFVSEYFIKKVRSSLVPIMLSKKRLFPELKDASVYLLVRLFNEEEEDSMYAIMEIPSNLDRIVPLPTVEGKKYAIFLDDIIRHGLSNVFATFDYDNIEAYSIKITRDAELDIDDDISVSLMEKMDASIQKRKKGNYVRLIYDAAMPESMVDFLCKQMKISDRNDLIQGGRYSNKKDLMSFPVFGMAQHNYKKMPPLAHPDLKTRESIFEVLKEKDILLQYPYQSFDYIISWLREAAIDPQVKRIKINLYRVAKDSKIMNALINAVQNGKEVEVVVELRARFDESNNIKWANVLQEAGVKVVFGIPGLKVHSKLIFIERKERGKLVNYVHIGTGNFHEKTAQIYSDTSLLTSNAKIAGEVKRIFSFFTQNYQRTVFRHLIISPYSTRRRFSILIDKEIQNAKKGRVSYITLKLNNLVDPLMIRKLYEASAAGVKVKLIIRGICSLIPGVKDLSENIEAFSIVGRFLEHSRIFIFANGGDEKIFISSADWMTRNIDKRIEVSVPIYDKKLKADINDMIDIQCKDNVKSRIIDKNQSNIYQEAKKGDSIFDSHKQTYQYFKKKLKK